jgi:2-polyprenyl-3-methyl-5-hydroxy-6-metoxy-1,4-benzoquinol methylase
MTQERSAIDRNMAFYQGFWEETPDFVRYNPGARHRRRLILDCLSSDRFSSVLDVGCGSGGLLALLHEAHPEITALTGVDLSPDQVVRNRARLPGMEFLSLDVQKGVLDRTFDLVVCSEVIEHLDDQCAAVKHLASMVSPGGRLVLTCPTGEMYPTERHFGHVRHPGAEDLVAWTREAGLETVSLWNWGWPAYRLLKWATNVDAEWALKRFASGSYSLGAKLVSDGLYWVNFLNRHDDARGCQLVGVFRALLARE